MVRPVHRQMIVIASLLAPLSVSNFIPTNVVSDDATNANSRIVLDWDPPSDRNGSFNTLITYSAIQIFTYDVNRVQTISDSLIIEDQDTNTLTLSGDDILPFADYNITIIPFNRLFGRSLSAPTVLRMVTTVPIGRQSLLCVGIGPSCSQIVLFSFLQALQVSLT